MHDIYKRECRITLIAFVVATLLTHIYPLYFLFPGLTKTTTFGFPTHYLLTLVLGWVVLMPLYWLYIVASEKVEREIERADSTGHGGGSVRGANTVTGGRTL